VLGYLVIAVGLAIQLGLRELARRKRRPLVAWIASTATGWLTTSARAVAFFMCNGVPSGAWEISQVKPDYPAAGKLDVGDRIIAVDGTPVAGTAEIGRAVNGAGGKPVTLTVVHDGTPRDVTVTPRRDPQGNTWLLGIVQNAVHETPAIPTALGMALMVPIEDTIERVHEYVLGSTVKDAGGPTRLVVEMNRAMADRTFQMLIGLSVSLMLVMLLVDFARAIASWRRAPRSSGSKS